MLRTRALLCSLVLSLCVTPALAAKLPAKPHVALHLSGDLISVVDGKTIAKPVADVVLKKGDLVRYTIVATNEGGAPAIALKPADSIPKQSAYVAGSASGAGGSVEFSLDNKHWSARPTVTVQTAHGPVTRAADPSTYVAIRWVVAHPLAPKHHVAYSYEVRVK